MVIFVAAVGGDKNESVLGRDVQYGLGASDEDLSGSAPPLIAGTAGAARREYRRYRAERAT